MMLTNPLSANSRSSCAVSSGSSSYWPNAFGRPAFGITADVTGRDARQLREVRPHLARAERAVEADAERPGVLDRDVERVERLTRQRAAAAIGDRHRDHQRQPHAALVERLLDADQRGLGVERVEDGFEQQQVRAAVDQPERLLGVGRRASRRRSTRGTTRC